MTATAVPPLSDGAGLHGSETTHAATIAESASTATRAGAMPSLAGSGIWPISTEAVIHRS